MPRPPRVPQAGRYSQRSAPPAGRELVIEVCAAAGSDACGCGVLVRDGATGAILGRQSWSSPGATIETTACSGLIAGLELVRQLDPAATVAIHTDCLQLFELARRRKLESAAGSLVDRIDQLLPEGTAWALLEPADLEAAGTLAAAAVADASTNQE